MQLTSIQGMTVGVYNSYRILQPNGTVFNGNWTVASCAISTQNSGTGIIVPVNGWLQFFTSQINPTAGQSQGTAYINQYLLTSMPTGGGPTTCASNSLALSNIGTLLSGWPTGSEYPGGYPFSGIQSPWSIPPYTTTLSISNPAAGANWTSGSLSAFGRVCIQSVFFQLTTSATVANRQVVVRLSTGGPGNVQMIYPATITQPASTTVLYSFSPGTPAIQFNVAGGQLYQTAPFANGAPACFDVNGAVTVDSISGSLQAADQFSFIAILIQIQNDNN
jgi:hypothetical protein